MADEMTCERCQQPIEVGQLYHQVKRHTDNDSADPAQWTTISDLFRVVHDYPCPDRFKAERGL